MKFTTSRVSVFLLAVIFSQPITWDCRAATIVADTVADFASPQGANGFTYGYFTSYGAPATFTSGGMTFDGTFWRGPFTQVPSTAIPPDFPWLSATEQHPMSLFDFGGLANVSAVRRFTASELASTTQVTIAGSYADSDIGGGDSQTVRIFVDGVQMLEDDLIDDSDTVKGFSFTAMLTPSSVVDFEVDPNVGFFFDSTLFTATITVVPEPASFALLTFGVLPLCYRRRTSIHLAHAPELAR